ncbi:cardiolipin synthase [Lacinutrix salivirga]
MIDFIKNNIWLLLIVLNYILAISAVITIFFKRINPTKTLSYIIVLVFFPFIGLLVYYLFGQEYRKNKIFSRKNVLNQSIIQKAKKELELSKSELESFDNELESKMKLVKLLHHSENTPLTVCNNITFLKNGEVKFEALLKDLKAAKHHIHLEYYIFKDDDIGTQIITILCEKAKEGVEVRLNVDDVGSSISSKSKSKLKEAGVMLFPFMPVLFTKFTGTMNYRNHRKIVIIDGKIGYIGGINVSDEYVNKPEREKYWRDTHMRIVGEAVAPLQIYFLTNWDFVSDGKTEFSEHFFPKNDCKDKLPIQIAGSGPDTDWANIMEAIFSAILTADEYIYITTPYLIPNDEIIKALQVASKSGIEVKILIPDISDSWTAKYATNSYLEELLEANIEIYRYTKGFIHAKTMVVDDVFCTVGTSNMDYRSFNINFEINALIYDKAASLELKSHFLEDVKHSKKMNLEQWTQRSKAEKFKESYCRLWAPLL